MDAALATAIFTGISGLVIAVATCYKTVNDIKAMKATIEQQAKRITAQDQRITTLEHENGELREENRELREQNTVLAGVNEEYRKRLLPVLNKRGGNG